ncbi:hypothetical protein MA16_Dca009365 [Dendrobium catenatum]|uniref:Uncharacterized protein n=1 Tax=Dendrobium catenatum TaxID=906689 RepID=A0A2I0XH24_9ASPA|nr:hypothetical protein MA16_Dca009365 [Dendrobium catenatum]
MKALLVHQGTYEAISRESLATIISSAKTKEIQLTTQCMILLSLSDEVLREVVVEDSTIEAWEKLESHCQKRSLTN